LPAYKVDKLNYNGIKKNPKEIFLPQRSQSIRRETQRFLNTEIMEKMEKSQIF